MKIILKTGGVNSLKKPRLYLRIKDGEEVEITAAFGVVREDLSLLNSMGTSRPRSLNVEFFEYLIERSI